MKKAGFGVLFLIVVFTPNLWAQQTTDNVWQAASSPVYGTKFGGMLGRGLLNVATCFVDVIVHVVDGTKEGPPFVGTLTGLGSGIGCTALRVTSGALDIVTSWVPDFNGFPISRSYHNCLEFEEGEMPAKTEEVAPSAPQPPIAAPVAPAPSPEDYAKPAAPRKHDAMEYVKK